MMTEFERLCRKYDIRPNISDPRQQQQRQQVAAHLAIGLASAVLEHPEAAQSLVACGCWRR